MSARYEISEGELDVLAITGPEGTRYIDGEEIEARVIRQQSADIAELRAELAAAVAERDYLRTANSDGAQMLQALITSRDAWKCSAEQAEARLAAIEAAPAVAVVCGTPDGFTKWISWLPYAKDATPIDVDLIARPAKDSKSTFEETARSIGIRFNDIENHENQP